MTVTGISGGYDGSWAWKPRSWTLTVNREPPDFSASLGSYLPFARMRYQLDRLVVTPEQAQAICARARPATVRVSVQYGPNYGDGPRVRLDGIEVTPEEAGLIARGVPPVAVLVPRLAVRPLTLEELERA